MHGHSYIDKYKTTPEMRTHTSFNLDSLIPRVSGYEGFHCIYQIMAHKDLSCAATSGIRDTELLPQLHIGKCARQAMSSNSILLKHQLVSTELWVKQCNLHDTYTDLYMQHT